MDSKDKTRVIPYSRQDVRPEDESAVVDVLRSDFLTQGPMVPCFEEQLILELGAKNVVVVNSATSALHIACLSLGVTVGDIVWTSANTFAASANAPRYCGANVDFIDIDKLTFNISIKALEEKLLSAEINGKLPKVLIVVHFAGQPMDMTKIYKLSRRYNFRVIEDASHALGAVYDLNEVEAGEGPGFKVGCCIHSDITVLSFHPVKMITTGEGGCIATNDDQLALFMRRLRTHGILKDVESFEEEPWRYDQTTLGFNYRMTDLQAALGVSQLRRLGENVELRREKHYFYNAALEDLPVVCPYISPTVYSSHHLYVICFENAAMRHRAFTRLRSAGIGVNVHYIPVYLLTYYKELYNYPRGYCRNSEEYYHMALSLPIFPHLTEDDQHFVVENLRRLFI